MVGFELFGAEPVLPSLPHLGNTKSGATLILIIVSSHHTDTNDMTEVSC